MFNTLILLIYSKFLMSPVKCLKSSCYPMKLNTMCVLKTSNKTLRSTVAELQCSVALILSTLQRPLVKHLLHLDLNLPWPVLGMDCIIEC